MLWQYFLDNDKKVIHKCLHYFPIYERYFSPWRNKSMVFLEIGVFRGGSLQMWKRYFGPHATIVGIDIDPECKAHEEEGVHVRIGSQSDPGFLESVVEEFGRPAIVLDDGSHKMADLKSSFLSLYNKVEEDGIYMLEDLCTCYWSEYGGGVKEKGSFIEYCKDLIDDLQAYNTRGAMKPSAFTSSTNAIHIHDSVIVFEKMRHEAYRSRMTGEGRGMIAT